LFDEKLDLFAALLKQVPVTWQGKLRRPLKDQLAFPPVEHGRLKTWIGAAAVRSRWCAPRITICR
jgi:alkanesulfonate monooxygenase SsuD/methylene tetrahydromethanopterin reductase-like flavin-dependent oxidoreductase (luciferase family)